MRMRPVVCYLFLSCSFFLISPVAALCESVNLLSLQEGCLPVVVPPTYSGWDAQNVLDDSSSSGWASDQGHVNSNVFVFEMAFEAVLESFEFDTAAIDTQGSAAKDIIVEVSKTSGKDGYEPILQAGLENAKDGQKFEAGKKVPARWVRLTITTNYGSPDYSELFSFKGYGERPAVKLTSSISGTYSTDYSSFHVLQQGTALSGCYEYNEGLLNGAIEGRVMKITWREGGEDNAGPAVMVFSEDGQSFKGFWWRKGGETGAPSGVWNGTRTSRTVGNCSNWSGSYGGELKKQLDTLGRIRIYGIRFALNSAVIAPESYPILAEVVALLKNESAGNLSVEGHTDSTGSADRNQVLSRQRAESVKAYLVAGGIAAERLATAGFGADVPVAGNGTEVGQAQNRRVELVRK
jgi:outer membrane protein OmpA-like peptidoglycan-associated protein